MPFILVCRSRPLRPIIFLFLLLLSKVAPAQAQVAGKSGLSFGGIGLGVTPVQHQIALGSVAEEPLGSCGNKPTGPIDATLCDYETVESVNDDLDENLQILLQVPFFKYVQMELYRGCPFWEDDGTCMESTCSIEHVDESQVPEEWRIKTLSRVNPVIDTYHELEGCYYRDSDFCFLEDPKSGEYYDLTTIPERYTGYTGASPHQIWRAIYEENCFTTPKRSEPGLVLQEENEEEDVCLEEKVYNKVISGLHASISTHICLDYLNQTTGEWGPNLQCYLTRVASHPQRLEYIYFNAVLLLRAIHRISPHLEQYDYYLGMSESGVEETKRSLERVVDIAQQVGRFDESLMFRGVDALSLREEFKAHFRNVSRIMDCIECEQCRLWGKVQTAGIATALKILFEWDESKFLFAEDSSVDGIIQRSELAALFNTLNRFSESLGAATRFREMWLEVQPEEDTQESTAVDEGSTSSASLLFHYCKDRCVDGVARLWTKGLRSLEVFMNRRSEEESSSKVEL